MCLHAPDYLARRIRAAIAAQRRPLSGAEVAGIVAAGGQDRPCSIHLDGAIAALLRKKLVRLAEDGAVARAEDPLIALRTTSMELTPLPGGPSSHLNTRIVGSHYAVFLDEEHVLGRGLQGAVHLALHVTLGRLHAVKILHFDPGRSGLSRDELIARFKQECLLPAHRGDHHIVRIDDLGEDGSEIYSVMEYVPGGSLADLVRRGGPLSPGRTMELHLQMAGTLDRLVSGQTEKIHHRDIKPQNILFDGSLWKITDFGFARRVLLDHEAETEGGNLTRTGLFLGTRQLAAPELWEGRAADERSDQYALGATAYFAATGGRYPWEVPDDSIAEWKYRHLHSAPTPITESIPDFPRPLEAIILRCLAKEPERRFESFAALTKALLGVAGAVPPPAGEPVADANPARASGADGISSVVCSSVLSRVELDLMTVTAEYAARFGNEAIATRPELRLALTRIAKKEAILDLAARLHARMRGTAVTPDFADRVVGSLEAAARGEGPSASSDLPLDVREYAWMGLRLADEDKATGKIPDTTPVEAIVAFLKRALDAPELARFRVDASTSDSGAPPAGPSIAPAPLLVEGDDEEEILPPPDEFVGRTVADYEVVELLGRGAQARVYRAVHKPLGRPVALKILHSYRAADPDYVLRFLREAKAAAHLSHPNVAQVYDAGQEGEVVWIAYELAPGKTLARVLAERKTLATAEVLAIARELLAGLAAIHRVGFVHRDIKPENVLVAEDPSRPGRWTAKIADFGLMRTPSPQPGETITKSGEMVGSPHFASPEQCRGDDVDARTDLYSVGVVLYYALSGLRPYEEMPSATSIVFKVGSPEALPPPLATHRPDLPAGLLAFVDRLTAKKREDRYASADEATRALDAIVASPGGSTAGQAPYRSRKWIAAAALAGAALLAALLVWRPFTRRPSDRPKTTGPATNVAISTNENPNTKPDGGPTTAKEDKTKKIVDKSDAKKEEVVEIPAGIFLPYVPVMDAASSNPWVQRVSLERIRQMTLPSRDNTLQAYLSSHAVTPEELLAIRSALEIVEKHDAEIQKRNYAPAIAELETVSRAGTAYVTSILKADIDRLRQLRDLENRRNGADEETFYFAVDPVDRIFWRTTHGDAARAIEALTKAIDSLPEILPHIPGLVHAIALRAIAAIDPKDVGLAKKVLDDLRGLEKILPGKLRYAFLRPCEVLAYEIAASEALGRKDYATFFLKFERSRSTTPTAEQLLRAFRASLLQDEFVGAVEFMAWESDVFDAPGGKVTFERNPERIRLYTARANHRAWFMKQFQGAKQGYHVRWRLPSSTADQSILIVSFYSKDNPDRRRGVEITKSAAELYRSDDGTRKTVSTVAFPSATLQGVVTVLPLAGVTLVYLDDQVRFVLPSSDYPLDDGIRLGAGGTVEIESIRVINRERE